ncbi:MAG TPA: c-type cytochrome [Kiloniellaceae bacterium]|nr:c-type cytochrome [Kiloniellaceae bacterium]
MLIRIGTAMLLTCTTLASTAQAEGDPAKGQTLVRAQCARCHGLDGNARSTSIQPVPMLAGQPAVYLLQEMKNYAAGKREDTSKQQAMTRELSYLTEQDMEDIAVFFAAQERY